MPIKFSELESISYDNIDSFVGLQKDSQGRYYNKLIQRSSLTSTIDTRIKNMLNSMFPVGSLYLAMVRMDKCPLELLGVGVWVRPTEAENKCLQGSSNTLRPGNTIAPGLPSVEHTHKISKEKVILTAEGKHAHGGNTLNVYGYFGGGDGYYGDNKVFKKFNNSTGGAGVQAGNKFSQQKYEFSTAGNWSGSTSLVDGHTHYISGTTDINSSINGIYGTSNTVQPPAYVVDVWKRMS